MRKLSAVLSIAIFLTNTAPAFAKHHESDNGAENKDKDKKHLLIDDIVEAVQTEKKLSDDELAELKKKQKERLDRIIDVIAEKTKMSDEDKTKLKEKIAARKDKDKDHPKKEIPPEVKEMLEKKFDLKNFCHETTYQVLSDHLDDSDLKAILKFVKSKTGQKLFREAPDMVGQAIELSAEKYVPIIMELSKQMKSKHPGFLDGMPPMLSPKDNNPEHRKEMMEKWKEFLKEKMQKTPGAPGKDET